MNARKNLVALAIAAVLGASPLVNLARAAETPQDAPAASAQGVPTAPGKAGAVQSASASDAAPDTAAGAAKDGSPAPIIRTVAEVRQAVQDIHAARLAIFEGLTDDAAKLVEDAVGNLDEAQASLAARGIPAAPSTGQAGRAGQAGKSDDQALAKADADGATPAGDAPSDYLPFDTSIALLEGFVPQPRHREALEQAGQKMQKGDQKGAAESLKLAEIDLSVTAAMIPAKSSLDHVRQAEKLIGQQKWHEANLALKAIEDSIVVGSWEYDGLPRQGVQGGDVSQQSGTPSADATAPRNG